MEIGIREKLKDKIIKSENKVLIGLGIRKNSMWILTSLRIRTRVY